MSRTVGSIAAMLAVSLLACVDQTSLPQPQPIPGLVRRSTPAMTASDPQTLVVGLPGAVPGVGELALRRTLDGLEVRGPSSEKGSFSLVIAGGGDELQLRYRNDQGESEPLMLFAPLQTEGPFLSKPKEPNFDWPVSPPDAQGNVTVTNDSGGPEPHFFASADSEVLVSNESNAAVAVGTTAADGLFSLKLAGATGDAIHILVAAPADPAATSDFLTYEVP